MNKIITTNGLNNPEFKYIKDAILLDLKILSEIINSEKGHLGDVISGIKTQHSRIVIKVELLKSIFREQKMKFNEAV